MDSMLVIQPLIAGLSVGAFCLTYCFPFMGSYLAAEERPLRKNFLVILEFLIGRLIGYLCFGLLAGYLGEKFDSRWLRAATNISFIFLSLVLMLYLMGLIKKKSVFCYSAKFFRGKSPPPFLKIFLKARLAKGGPLLMGFFMGINLCPPFLLSVAYIVTQHNTFYGMLYFALFFLSSSIYFLPLVFVGMLSRTNIFRTVARLSGALVSLFFFVYGIYSLLHNV